MEDYKIRKALKDKLKEAAVPRIQIERDQSLPYHDHSARPGVVIGRKGAEIDKIKEELSKMTGKEVYVEIAEIKKPELDAQLVAENICMQLERRGVSPCDQAIHAGDDGREARLGFVSESLAA